MNSQRSNTPDSADIVSITPNGARFSFVSAESTKAKTAYTKLISLYGQCDPESADIIIALGGDGFMLQTLHKYGTRGKAIYGMNRGTVGFLLNNYAIDNLPARLDSAVQIKLHRLSLKATCVDGTIHHAQAVNEVALFRQTAQSANIEVSVDEVTRLDKLICDGILVATPAGSTAYNLSAQGPILPLTANLLALTPVSAFRPRRWKGALLDNKSKVRLTVLHPEKRPVAVTADSREIRDVSHVSVEAERSKPLTLCFDPNRLLHERMLQEQFAE